MSRAPYVPPALTEHGPLIDVSWAATACGLTAEFSVTAPMAALLAGEGVDLADAAVSVMHALIDVLRETPGQRWDGSPLQFTAPAGGDLCLQAVRIGPGRIVVSLPGED